MTKMVEISEEEFLNNQKLRETVKAILDNPEARPLVLAAQKKAFPNTVIPELDAQKPVMDAIAEMKKEQSEFIKSQKEKSEKDEQDKKLAELNTRFARGKQDLIDRGYTAEGIKAVEDLMQAKGIMDHEDARVLFEKANPTPTPVVSNGMGGFGFFDMPKDKTDETMKRLIESKGEDVQALSSLVNSALADSRGQNRR